MDLKRGINLGGFLSQCEHKLEHYDEFIREEDIRRIQELGFDHVRLPIDYEVLETPEGAPYEEGLKFVDKTVAWAKQYGLNIILDLHKACGYDFNDANDDSKNTLFSSEPLKQRFVALWERMAKRYGEETHVAFELLNEVVEDKNADLWNDLIARSVKAIRQYAPDSPIVYGGIMWNSTSTLKYLEKPEDKNIIFTFHFYEPLIFTHQKAYWVAGMEKVGDVAYPESMEYYYEQSKLIGAQGSGVHGTSQTQMGKDFMREKMMEAIEAAKAAGVGLYCGEFGVIDQAPVEDTLRWFQDVDAVFREFDIGCAVWSYKKMDFGLIDEHYAPVAKEIFDCMCKKAK